LIPVTFLINLPLRQVIVFFFGATFFTSDLVAEGVGDGFAKTVLGVALSSATRTLVRNAVAVTSSLSELKVHRMGSLDLSLFLSSRDVFGSYRKSKGMCVKNSCRVCFWGGCK